MAVRWDGFSEEDIKKLKNKGNDTTEVTRKVEPSPLVIQKRATLSVTARRSCDRLSTQALAAATAAAAVAQQKGLPAEDVPEQARLASLASLASLTISTSKSETNGSTEMAEASATAAASPEGVKQDTEPVANGNRETPNPLGPSGPFTLSRPRSLVSALMAPTLSAPPPPAIDIDDFESRQKMMEEQNRLKKVFLSKALEDRKKQASAEAKRLNMIQEELQKLDQRLSGDVSIIRNQIESASIEFLEAQKRYDRAEKEFLEAKMLFFTKLERKELLTHHLCTIIEQNEMRKAQKLSELMEKLDLRAEMPENSSAGDDEKPNLTNSGKVSAEVILTPSEAGGIGTGNAPPDSLGVPSTTVDAHAAAETVK